MRTENRANQSEDVMTRHELALQITRDVHVSGAYPEPEILADTIRRRLGVTSQDMDAALQYAADHDWLDYRTYSRLLDRSPLH